MNKNLNEGSSEYYSPNQKTINLEVKKEDLITQNRSQVVLALQDLKQSIEQIKQFELYADHHDWEEWNKSYYYPLENYLDEARSSLAKALLKIDDLNSLYNRK